MVNGFVRAMFIVTIVGGSFTWDAFGSSYSKSVIFVGPGRPVIFEEFQMMLQHYDRLQLKRMVIPVFGCQPDGKSNEVGSCELYVLNSFEVAQWALDHGLQIDFLPIVLTPGGEWRGEFTPTEPDQWFKTYATWIVSVAIKAQQLGVTDFHAGTEFKSLYKYADSWRKVINQIRAVFFGKLLVTANWDSLDLDFWDAVDAFALSYYFPLSQRAKPSDSELLKGQKKIQKRLIKKSKRISKKIYITELGYPSIVTAASHPWYFPGGCHPPIDLQLQARAFQSFIQTWKDSKDLEYVGIWGSFAPHTEYSKYTFEIFLKPVEDILKKLFRAI